MPDVNKQVTPVEKKRRPPAAGMGRKKGSVNKITKTIKEAIEVSFIKVGGAEYLAKMAIEQPVAYMTLLGKIIPQQLEHSNPDGTMTAPPTRIVIEAAHDNRKDGD